MKNIINNKYYIYIIYNISIYNKYYIQYKENIVHFEKRKQSFYNSTKKESKITNYIRKRRKRMKMIFILNNI